MARAVAKEEQQRSESAKRGRGSRHPRDLPRPAWRDILLRTKDSIGKDHVGLLSAGMAFFGLLAIFPAVAAAVSIYGLFSDPQQIQQHFQAVAGLMPEQTRSIITERISQVAQSDSGTLSLAAAGSLLVALWGSTKGVKAFMMAMNVAYGEEEKRGLIKQNLIALGLTLFLIVFGLLALITIVAVPAVIDSLQLGTVGTWLVMLLRWPLIAAVFILMLSVLYRYTPSREDAKWRWVTPGSVAAIALWLVLSIAFSVYVRNFGNYNEIYGSLGAVAALMMWLWLSSFVVVLGAELNAESERQTRRDSTTGEPKPIGTRGAHAADTVGESR